MCTGRAGDLLSGLPFCRHKLHYPVALNRWRYALVFPCPITIAARFEVMFSFMFSLFCKLGKYCFVLVALTHFSNWICHFCLAYSAISGSSVGIATDYGLDGPGIESR
jgi:hypothetical protein